MCEKLQDARDTQKNPWMGLPRQLLLVNSVVDTF